MLRLSGQSKTRRRRKLNATTVSIHPKWGCLNMLSLTMWSSLFYLYVPCCLCCWRLPPAPAGFLPHSPFPPEQNKQTNWDFHPSTRVAANTMCWPIVYLMLGINILHTYYIYIHIMLALNIQWVNTSCLSVNDIESNYPYINLWRFHIFKNNFL